jgi:RNA polymerase sigma-70 factor, ECF subfamily
MSETDLETIYNEFRSRLYSFILKRVKDKDVTEDILHEVFLKIHKKSDQLKDVSKIESWIYSIARNTITDHFRGKKFDEITEEHDEAVEVSEQSDIQKTLNISMRSMILKIPQPYRDALVQADLRRKKQTDLAKKYGLSVSAIKSRVQRARKMLKEMLMQCCHFEFDKFGIVIDYNPICCKRCEHCKD